MTQKANVSSARLTKYRESKLSRLGVKQRHPGTSPVRLPRSSYRACSWSVHAYVNVRYPNLPECEHLLHSLQESISPYPLTAVEESTT